MRKDEHIKSPFNEPKKTVKKQPKMGSGLGFANVSSGSPHFSNIKPEEWKPKDFAHWFKDCLENELPSMSYKIIYSKDCGVISSIIQHFEDNGFSQKDVKVFIEKIIQTKAKQAIQDKIQAQTHEYASFTVNDLMNYHNTYIQELLFNPEAQKQNILTNIGVITRKEITICYMKSKTHGLLRNYGIPITVNYLWAQAITLGADVDETIIMSHVKKIINDLNNNDFQSVIKHSILRAPYHSAFKLLDWRKYFSETQSNGFKQLTWWKDEDEIDDSIEWFFLS